MKKLIFLGLMISSSLAYANLQCGLKPLPPLGCEVAYCQCDDDGCRWVFSCR